MFFVDHSYHRMMERVMSTHRCSGKPAGTRCPQIPLPRRTIVSIASADNHDDNQRYWTKYANFMQIYFLHSLLYCTTGMTMCCALQVTNDERRGSRRSPDSSSTCSSREPSPVAPRHNLRRQSTTEEILIARGFRRQSTTEEMIRCRNFRLGQFAFSVILIKVIDILRF